MSLSRGGLQAVLVEGRPACPLVLQVISAAEMRNGRFKLELSDSVHTTLGVSGSQLHELMRTVRPGSVVEVPTHTIVRVRNRMVLTVLDMRVLQQEAALMGTPVPLEDASIIAPSSNGDDAIPPHAGCTAQHSPTPSSATNNAAIVPISQLNPYMNNWTVKARVMEKSAVRCWNKTGKEGQLFTVDLKDASGDIRAVAFNAEVSRLFEQLQLHKVYKITRSRLRLADKRWNKLEHDYEICFTPQSVLTPCEDGQCADVPKQFNHRAIVKLASVSPGTMLSIICVVVSISDLHATVKSKRRIMTVGDCSNAVADVTLWGQLAEECELQPGHVAAFQSLRVSDYNGRSLTSTSATRMIPGPTDYEEETQSLREWYESGGPQRAARLTTGAPGKGKKAVEHSTIAALSGLYDNQLPSTFEVRACVTFIRQGKWCYPACASCARKAVSTGSGRWTCCFCTTEFDAPNWRYVASVQLSDHTGAVWASFFDDCGCVLIGCQAGELVHLQEQEGPDAVNAVFKTALFRRYMFTLRVTPPSGLHTAGGDCSRVVLIRAVPLAANWAQNARELAAQIPLL
eukprot:TRINITY_DN2087_c0_g1_i1.p1 TRINITY_DN2087_c0_g1~~TRINITY_DN2087_c0_g1_i1.p1  ORF type:complete len:580 (+),score=88.66 TRINITY_DN2087_c0_g1_i1:30-1742(+)